MIPRVYKRIDSFELFNLNAHPFNMYVDFVSCHLYRMCIDPVCDALNVNASLINLNLFRSPTVTSSSYCQVSFVATQCDGGIIPGFAVHQNLIE